MTDSPSNGLPSDAQLQEGVPSLPQPSLLWHGSKSTEREEEECWWLGNNSVASNGGRMLMKGRGGGGDQRRRFVLLSFFKHAGVLANNSERTSLRARMCVIALFSSPLLSSAELPLIRQTHRVIRKKKRAIKTEHVCKVFDKTLSRDPVTLPLFRVLGVVEAGLHRQLSPGDKEEVFHHEPRLSQQAALSSPPAGSCYNIHHSRLQDC